MGRQRRWCCGSDNCTIEKCTKQTRFVGDKYTLTFRATGCPNYGPTSRSFWTNGPDSRTFADMFSYCKLTKAGTEDDRQRKFCCGYDSCTINKCVKQNKFV